MNKIEKIVMVVLCLAVIVLAYNQGRINGEEVGQCQERCYHRTKIYEPYKECIKKCTKIKTLDNYHNWEVKYPKPPE